MKIPGIATFQESLIAFEQIPAIPAKFREIFIEKSAISMYSQQKFAKSWMIADFFFKICENLENVEFEAVQRYVNLVDLQKILKNE